MDRASLLGIVDNLRGKTGLVVGDVMLDEYIWGAVDRISPEAPVPVVHVRKETKTVGGAGNVALNVHALGLKVYLTGIVGNDYFGRVVTKVLKNRKISTDGLVVGEEYRTIVKTRIIAHSQQVVRIDREEKESIKRKTFNELVKKIGRLSKEADFIIVSDYNKGTVCEEVYEPVVEIAGKRAIPVFVDPKKRDVSFYRGCFLIKPNKKEAELFSGVDIESEDDVNEAGKRIMKKTRSKAVLITRGGEGMTLVRRGDFRPVHLPAFTKEVYDVTGAGDTVMSVVAAALVAGADLTLAAVLSNIAAGVVVGEVGTSPITVEKLVRAVKRLELNENTNPGGSRE